jgi:hypothetical protein
MGTDVEQGQTGEPISPADATSRLDSLLIFAQGGESRRVLRRVSALQASLSGAELAESFFIQLVASAGLEDAAGVCQAAQQVISTHPNPERVAQAQRAIELIGCDSVPPSGNR